MKNKVFIIFTIMVGVVFSCQHLIVIPCPPDGTPVTVLRDPIEAYPVYAVSYSVGVTASLSKIAEILNDPKISVEVKGQLTEFRDKLNQESATIENVLKTSFMGFQTRPCDPINRDKFWEIQKAVIDRGIYLAQLASQLAKITEVKSGTWNDPVERNVLPELKKYDFYK